MKNKQKISFEPPKYFVVQEKSNEETLTLGKLNPYLNPFSSTEHINSNSNPEKSSIYLHSNSRNATLFQHKPFPQINTGDITNNHPLNSLSCF
jgi:hypothetical protein